MIEKKLITEEEEIMNRLLGNYKYFTFIYYEDKLITEDEFFQSFIGCADDCKEYMSENEITLTASEYNEYLLTGECYFTKF